MLASYPSDLARVAHVAKVSDRKFFDPTWLKILTSKQILERLPTALARIKAGNTSKNLLNEHRWKKITKKEWKKLLKKYITI